MTWPTSFDAPERLLLLVAVLALVGAYVVQQVRGRSRRRAWTSDALLPSAAPRRAGPLRHVVAGLLALGLTALTTAFAEPRAEREVRREQATVVIALDASSSMLAQDVPPDRFTAAKAAASGFVDELPASFDVGLVTFNATATLRVPPTQEHDRIVDAFDALQLEGGTALGDALQISLDALSSGGGEAVGAVVLLTDGGSTGGSPVTDAVQRAASAGVPVSTIAYGTPDGVLETPAGQVPVPADEQALADIAEGTDGTSYTAETADELVDVLDGIRSRLTTRTERADVSADLVGVAVLLLTASAVPALLRR